MRRRSRLSERQHVMALYKINTNRHEQEGCKLKWQWEIAVEGLGTTVFLVPAEFGGRSDDAYTG